MRFPYSFLAPSVALLVLTGCVPENSPAPAKSAQATAPALKPAEQPATVASTPATPAATPARAEVQALIDQVEAAYQRGVTNYHAGKLKIAKTDFDRAVDLMLTSNLDLHNEPLLHDEFDRVLDAVNTLEMEALKQGNGFAPKLEPAPVDIANDVTFPVTVDPTVKAQAIQELKTTQSDLPLVINDPVAGFISAFSSPRGRGTLMRSLERAGRYQAMIKAVLAEEGVPQDLIYQAVAESGFQPQAMNGRTGAGGMWQFMPYGVYGLNRTGWYDERFDPEKSTRAYARYMKTLYAQLGDWYLAMAAYDWGPGNVQKAVQRTGYADFWELYRRNSLPQETKNYVPAIIAAAIMAKNPQQYGLSVTPDPALLADTVNTDYSVDLRLVADIVEAPVQEIADLNPSLLRMGTPAEDTFALRLPAGRKDLYEKRIAEIPVDKRNQWRFHKVVAGESLASVARDYRVTPSEIVFVNQLEANDDLSATDSLIIPVPPAASSRSRLTLYRTRRGDTLVTVADRFNITVQQLRRWNHMGASKLEPGRNLYVAEPALVTRSKGSSSGSKRRVSATTSHTSHGGAQNKSTAHAAANKPATHSASTAQKNRSSASHQTTESVSLNR